MRTYGIGISLIYEHFYLSLLRIIAFFIYFFCAVNMLYNIEHLLSLSRTDDINKKINGCIYLCRDCCIENLKTLPSLIILLFIA